MHTSFFTEDKENLVDWTNRLCK